MGETISSFSLSSADDIRLLMQAALVRDQREPLVRGVITGRKARKVAQLAFSHLETQVEEPFSIPKQYAQTSLEAIELAADGIASGDASFSLIKPEYRDRPAALVAEIKAQQIDVFA